MAKLLGICFGCVVIAMLYAIVGFVVAWVIEWTWNLLAPALFHGPRIDFWMAYAIYIVLSLIAGLFRGFQG